MYEPSTNMSHRLDYLVRSELVSKKRKGNVGWAIAKATTAQRITVIARLQTRYQSDKDVQCQPAIK